MQVASGWFSDDEWILVSQKKLSALNFPFQKKGEESLIRTHGMRARLPSNMPEHDMYRIRVILKFEARRTFVDSVKSNSMKSLLSGSHKKASIEMLHASRPWKQITIVGESGEFTLRKGAATMSMKRVRRNVLVATSGAKTRWRAASAFARAGNSLVRKRAPWHTTCPVRVVHRGEYKVSSSAGNTLIWRATVTNGQTVKISVSFVKSSSQNFAAKTKVRPAQEAGRIAGIFTLPQSGTLVFNFDNSSAWYGSRDIEMSCCEIPKDAKEAKLREAMLPRWAFDVLAANEAGQTMSEYWDTLHKHGGVPTRFTASIGDNSNDKGKSSTKVSQSHRPSKTISLTIQNKIGHPVYVTKGDRIIWSMEAQEGKSIIFSLLFAKQRTAKSAMKENAAFLGSAKHKEESINQKTSLSLLKGGSALSSLETEVIEAQTLCEREEGVFTAKSNGNLIFLLDNSSSWFGSASIKIVIRRSKLHVSKTKSVVSHPVLGPSSSSSDEDLLFGTLENINKENQQRAMSENAQLKESKDTTTSSKSKDQKNGNDVSKRNTKLIPPEKRRKEKSYRFLVWRDVVQPLHVEVGSDVRWRWSEIEGNKINFRLTFQGVEADMVRRVLATADYSEGDRGRFIARECGTLLFEYDNTFSWFSEKQILLVTRVSPPKRHLSAIGHSLIGLGRFRQENNDAIKKSEENEEENEIDLKSCPSDDEILFGDEESPSNVLANVANSQEENQLQKKEAKIEHKVIEELCQVVRNYTTELEKSCEASATLSDEVRRLQLQQNEMQEVLKHDGQKHKKEVQKLSRIVLSLEKKIGKQLENSPDGSSEYYTESETEFSGEISPAKRSIRNPVLKVQESKILSSNSTPEESKSDKGMGANLWDAVEKAGYILSEEDEVCIDDKAENMEEENSTEDDDELLFGISDSK
eukprot:g5095.t1